MNIDYEQIEKYVLGELNAKELIDFNNRLDNDADFRKEVELYKSVTHSFQKKYQNIEKEEKLKSSLHQLGSKYFNVEEKNKKVNIRSYFVKFSSIAAILLIAFFLFKPQTDLYNQFAEHQTLNIQTKGDNQHGNLLQGATFFNEQKYEKAIPLFEDYLNKNPQDTEIKISLGISFLEEENTLLAIQIFKEVAEQDNVFKNKANWYLALSHIKYKDKTNAKKFLKKISPESSYYKKAQKLLQKL